jgi:thiamine pyrophosphate-dependent acetolactate synthase large subunit-like protein
VTQVNKTYTGGDIIVQALKAAGVDTIFGVISIHNNPHAPLAHHQR